MAKKRKVKRGTKSNSRAKSGSDGIANQDKHSGDIKKTGAESKDNVDASTDSKGVDSDPLSEEAGSKGGMEIDPTSVSVAFTKDEVETFANLLSITALTYQKLAMAAANENDEGSFNILSARQKLSHILAQKFVLFSRVGEPTSKEVH